MICFLFVASVAIAAQCVTGAEGSDKKRPNFVVFYTDDQGWPDTSVRMMKDRADSASDFYQTPNLERLAREGMRFSNAYAPSPTCTASRISIQFGKTTARLKQTTVHDVLAKMRGIDCADELSMAHVIKAADSRYVTAHFGKGMAIRRMEDTGYDITDEEDPGNHGNGNFHGDWLSTRDKKPLPADDPKRIFSLTRKANAFISDQAQADRPFFLMVSHYAVHVHHAALEETIEKYRAQPRGRVCRHRDYEDPASIPDSYKIGSWALQYAAMIDNLDSSLGSILEMLDRTGIADNTYVIFTSDNGGGFVDNGPLAGGKARMFEGGLRVPMVVRGPGVLADVQCDVPVAQWDLLPTIHDLCGSSEPMPKDIDGGSWQAVLTHGNRGEVKRPTPALIFHYPYYAGVPVSVVRLGDYKFMRQLNTGATRLHNVVEDLGEKDNLVEKMPEKAQELDRLMQDYLRKVDAESIEDMYAARFAELEDRKRRILKEEIPKYEQQMQRTDDPNEIASLKKKIEAARGPGLERIEKQINDTKKNQQKKDWM
jgi:arylsulfatase A-like enzyme